jgi:hypothetical protein
MRILYICSDIGSENYKEPCWVKPKTDLSEHLITYFRKNKNIIYIDTLSGGENSEEEWNIWDWFQDNNNWIKIENFEEPFFDECFIIYDIVS